jgi:hypothetical protein
LKQFHEHILPKVEEKILDIAKHLRITFSIAEGKTTAELNEIPNDVDAVVEFLHGQEQLHSQVQNMN